MQDLARYENVYVQFEDEVDQPRVEFYYEEAMKNVGETFFVAPLEMDDMINIMQDRGFFLPYPEDDGMDYDEEAL